MSDANGSENRNLAPLVVACVLMGIIGAAAMAWFLLGGASAVGAGS